MSMSMDFCAKRNCPTLVARQLGSRCCPLGSALHFPVRPKLVHVWDSSLMGIPHGMERTSLSEVSRVVSSLFSLPSLQTVFLEETRGRNSL